MIALEVEYLMGRVAAACHNDRRSVEWPPHPGRLFSALVAAYHESDLVDGTHPDSEKAENALRWLEKQDPPAIYAVPPDASSGGRDARMQFVPRNDTNEQQNLKGKPHPWITRNIPLGRPRADQRWFPALTPVDPIVCFHWPDGDPGADLLDGLAALASRVGYLGHSMSPVRVALSDKVRQPTLLPDSDGDVYLRSIGEGRLEHLRNVHELRRTNTAIQPHLGRLTRYTTRTREKRKSPHSLFTRWISFRKVSGPRLPLESTTGLMELVRRAVLERYPDPLPEWISGHTPNGEKSAQPHLGILPLSHVGGASRRRPSIGFCPDGPCSVSDEDWDLLEDALFEFDTLLLGSSGEWKIAQTTGAEQLPASLRAETWRRRATTWASVTPVVFGHYPKKRPGKDALAVLGASCRAIGLPDPVEVRMGTVSPHLGAPRAVEFPPPKQADGKLLAHVWLRFDEPVRGPVVIGAGRFVGMGLLKPYRMGRQR